MNKSAGFTLVEVLVVLMIVGFASVLLTQGLGQIFTARARLGPFIDQSEDAARIGTWFRQVVGGTLPDTLGGSNIFAGNTTTIQGLSDMPMGAAAGVSPAGGYATGDSALRAAIGTTIDQTAWVVLDVYPRRFYSA